MKIRAILGALAVMAVSAVAYAAVTHERAQWVFDYASLNGIVESNSTKLPTKATFTVGAKSGNNIDTQIVFKDGNGAAIAYPFETYCWESGDTAGAGYTTTANTAAFSAITNGFVESVTSGKSANVITSAAGLLGVRSTQTSATSPSEYLCCRLSLGTTACSGAIAFH